MILEQARRVNIYGVSFDVLDQDGVIDSIMQARADGRGGWVVTPNVDILRQVAADPALAHLVRRASLSIVDGAPVEWAGRIAGHPDVPRVTGASITIPLARAASEQDVPMLLLGGRPGAGTRAAANLRAALPGLRVTEHCPPYGFEADLDSWVEVVDAIRSCDGGIVFCGFGFPKQERLMAEMSGLFPRTWFLGIGGTIDFLGGDVRRAPLWVQRIGFEWTFRLLMEPRRLARRYLVHGIPFAVRLLTWAAQERRGTGFAIPAEPSVAGEPSAASPLGGAVERIDLDRRTVTITAGGSDPVSVELSFQEYRAALAAGTIPGRTQEDAAEAGPPVQIDLRDRSRVGAVNTPLPLRRTG